jgi:hypothetical protein
LTYGFRPVSDPSLHSPRFSGNQYAPSLLETRERLIKEKPIREYLSDEFGIDSLSAGILMIYFDLVVMLNISFIPTIKFPYSTGDPLLIIPSPMPWQLSFLGCCSVAGEPSEHWIVIWPAEYPLNVATKKCVTH